MCHVGAEETMEPFNENLRGSNVGDHKEFAVEYPADYPDQKLAGKKYNYAADVIGIKTKKLPELNDEFAKDVSDATSLDELKTKIKESLVHERDHRQKDLQREKIIAELIKVNDFPVPESLVEHQMDARLERVVRSLAQQGVDPRAVNVDWVTLRNRQAERAKEDVKAELIVDKIASTENIDATEEDVNHELEHAASHSNESVEAIRARLTKQGALDRMKAKLRSDKTLDWLAQNAKIRTAAATAGKKPRPLRAPPKTITQKKKYEDFQYRATNPLPMGVGQTKPGGRAHDILSRMLKKTLIFFWAPTDT